jgi:hydroxymethylbilane synthase
LRIGTRGSPLALAQAYETRERLSKAHGIDPDSIAIVVFKTTGDRVLDRPLAEIGGKGLFTKELEDALYAGEIDLAVHSMKDMQTQLPDGLILGATLPREDVRDAFLSLRYASIDEVPAGSTVGSSSLRRQAQLLNMRPDLNVVGFRGNVQTRLKKLEDGVAAATFLAVAGLKRLKLEDRITAMIPTGQMLPAVAQGAIGIEIKAEDERTAQFIAPLNHEPTALAVTAERAFLRKLEGSCRTPIAGLAEFDGSRLVFRGQVLSPDGKVSYRVERTDAPERAAQMGVAAAEEILAQADPAVLATVHS